MPINPETTTMIPTTDEFDLDIRVIESGDAATSLINLTDDGCGSTCASPCATNVA